MERTEHKLTPKFPVEITEMQAPFFYRFVLSVGISMTVLDMDGEN